MDDIIETGILTGVELFIGAIMISVFVNMYSNVQRGFAAISEQQTVIDNLREYREHNQYDGTTVYPQDVISAVYRYRGTPAVHVLSSLGAYSWSGTYAPCEWNTAAIAALIDQTVVYEAMIIYGNNGEVVAYEFKAR